MMSIEERVVRYKEINEEIRDLENEITDWDSYSENDKYNYICSQIIDLIKEREAISIGFDEYGYPV